MIQRNSNNKSINENQQNAIITKVAWCALLPTWPIVKGTEQTQSADEHENLKRLKHTYRAARTVFFFYVEGMYSSSTISYSEVVIKKQHHYFEFWQLKDALSLEKWNRRKNNNTSSYRRIFLARCRMPRNELLVRFCTVSIGVPIVVALLVNRPYLIVQSSNFLCALEWLRLAPNDTIVTTNPIVYLYPLLSLIIATCSNPLWLLSFLFATFHLATNNDTRVSHFQQGLLFVSVGHYHLLQIARTSLPHALYFMFIVWNCDTGALLGGKFTQLVYRKYPAATSTTIRRRLTVAQVWLKSISPKKTITGLISGLLFGVATAVFFPAVIQSLLSRDLLKQYFGKLFSIADLLCGNWHTGFWKCFSTSIVLDSYAANHYWIYPKLYRIIRWFNGKLRQTGCREERFWQTTAWAWRINGPYGFYVNIQWNLFLVLYELEIIF